MGVQDGTGRVHGTAGAGSRDGQPPRGPSLLAWGVSGDAYQRVGEYELAAECLLQTIALFQNRYRAEPAQAGSRR
jgi:hypothetical protein